MAALDVAGQARQHQVKRLVFARIGRRRCARTTPGTHLPFGEWGKVGRTYRIPVPGPPTAACADHATDSTEMTGKGR